jgi:hypothetical protein
VTENWGDWAEPIADEGMVPVQETEASADDVRVTSNPVATGTFAISYVITAGVPLALFGSAGMGIDPVRVSAGVPFARVKFKLMALSVPSGKVSLRSTSPVSAGASLVFAGVSSVFVGVSSWTSKPPHAEAAGSASTRASALHLRFLDLRFIETSSAGVLARSQDPSQRIGLGTSWRALDNVRQTESFRS